jgi:hypothetical protein
MQRIMENVKATLKVAWWNLAILTTLLVCIEGLAFGYYSVRRAVSGHDRVGEWLKTEAAKMPRDGYPNPEDQSWFEGYWKEFNDSTYAAVASTSYSNWHRYPFKGKYINVDQKGKRVTWNQDPPDRPGLIRIAIFGGSTTWGTGARDEFTIPSYVSKLLAEKYPHRFNITNYGQDGYVTTQEVIELLREIQRENIPDLVIFYDGYNETYTAAQSGAAGIPMNEDNRMREFNILHPSRNRDFYFEVLSRTNTFQLMKGLRTALWPQTVAAADTFKPISDEEALANAVVQVYFRNINFVTAMERRFGIVARFFWQPSVFTKAHPTQSEQSLIRNSQPVASLYKRVHEGMKQTQRDSGPASFRDISDALNAYPGTAYIDPIHSTELANETIARTIIAGLTDTLEQTASALQKK